MNFASPLASFGNSETALMFEYKAQPPMRIVPVPLTIFGFVLDILTCASPPTRLR